MFTRASLVLGGLVVVVAAGVAACGDDSGSAAPPVGAGGATSDDAAAESGADAGGSGGTAGSDAANDALVEDSSPDVETDGGSGPETGVDASEGGSACPRVPGPVDADRVVVVSHPYDSAGDKSNQYELRKLTASGSLTSTGETFAMGRGMMGDAVFTPDGEIGIVAQDDGTLGVFRVDAVGKPEVVHAAFKGGFYAARLVMHPSGERLYVLDSQWVVNGGGIYSVRIGCDGTLTDEGRIVEARLPYVLIPMPGAQGSAVVAAQDLLGSASGDDAHLIALEPQIERLASANPFADDDQIIASGTVTADGKYVLLGDNAAYSGLPNRVSVLEVGASSLVPTQMLSPIEDPMAIVASPFGSTAIVVSGFGDAIFVLDYDAANTTAPFSLRGELTYEGTGPQLPANAVMIDRGQLRGRVLVAENTSVRMVQFTAQGAGVTDLGAFGAGSGLETITGIVGVQP